MMPCLRKRKAKRIRKVGKHPKAGGKAYSGGSSDYPHPCQIEEQFDPPLRQGLL